MGTKEEVYVFDDDHNPSPKPVSVTPVDTRVLAEEQDSTASWLREMRVRALKFTEHEALDDLEENKKDKDLADHRKAVRVAFNTAIASVKAARSLAELDTLTWGKDIDDLYQVEFPESLGQKDPAIPKKLKESKSKQGDDISK